MSRDENSKAFKFGVELAGILPEILEKLPGIIENQIPARGGYSA